jgi:hypothetical protein
MLNLVVQATDLNAVCFQIKKYERRNKENNLDFFHSKTRKKDRHKLPRKTRYWIDFFKQENYLLTSLDNIFKNSLSGGRENPYIALDIDNKNLFFLKNYPTTPYHLEKQKDYLFCHLILREKEELENLLKKRPRQFRKKWQEIKLKTEILSKWDNPAKLVPGYKENGRPKPTWEAVGWNSPNYWEPKNRSLAALAFTHEIVLGKVDVPLLDLDPNKKDKDGNYKIKQEWLRKALVVGGKKWKSLINKYQVPYYWTTGTPGNCLVPIPYWLIGLMEGGKIYHQDTGEKIGDLLGVGDLVALPVGGDKNRQLVITEWGRKLVKKHGTEGIFNKKLLDGNASERVEEFLNGIYLSLNKPSVQKLGSKKRLISSEEKKQVENTEKSKRNIEVSISGKQKTCLEDIWKVFYFDWKTKQRGFFLVNDYQRNLDDLVIGETRNIMLVSGWKHEFFSRVI